MRSLSPVPVGMIWAQDEAGVLGVNDHMAWHVPDDFKHFKASTIGCPLVMGRTTFESLAGFLSGRLCIVMTRQESLTHPKLGEALPVAQDRPDEGWPEEGAVRATSLDDALTIARDYCGTHASAHHVWIAGGAAVYREAIEADVADELVVSTIDLDVLAHREASPEDHVAYAPLIDAEVWHRDPKRSDDHWRPMSKDAAWRVTTWVRR
ncbi:dihydrofolate reductase [Actinomyces vulturis]|uniref:dihydrofolate reductase n=1 Tax=Actinomyces vulturis TaxID=1857645 RepID=UPI00082CC861|nr:dihydrofolate reductase [Actinomyces vulturis]